MSAQTSQPLKVVEQPLKWFKAIYSSPSVRDNEVIFQHSGNQEEAKMAFMEATAHLEYRVRKVSRFEVDLEFLKGKSV